MATPQFCTNACEPAHHVEEPAGEEREELGHRAVVDGRVEGAAVAPQRVEILRAGVDRELALRARSSGSAMRGDAGPLDGAGRENAGAVRLGREDRRDEVVLVGARPGRPRPATLSGSLPSLGSYRSVVSPVAADGPDVVERRPGEEPAARGVGRHEGRVEDRDRAALAARDLERRATSSNGLPVRRKVLRTSRPPAWPANVTERSSFAAIGHGRPGRRQRVLARLPPSGVTTSESGYGWPPSTRTRSMATTRSPSFRRNFSPWSESALSPPPQVENVAAKPLPARA